MAVVSSRYEDVTAHTKRRQVGGSKPAQTAEPDPFSKTTTKSPKWGRRVGTERETQRQMEGQGARYFSEAKMTFGKVTYILKMCGS